MVINMEEAKVLIDARNLVKTYGEGEALTYALNEVSIKVYEHDFLVILGGSCAVGKEETADGFIYNRSTYYCLCDSSGKNIALWRRPGGQRLAAYRGRIRRHPVPIRWRRA